MTDEFHNIFEVLSAEHLRIRELFNKYANSVNQVCSSQAKFELINEICNLLSLHSSRERNVLFPAITSHIETTTEINNLINDVLDRQLRIEYGIIKIKNRKTLSLLQDARVTFLSYHVDDLIELEEIKLFTYAKKLTLEI